MTAVDADEATGLALLNCAVREICAPDRQVWPARPYLVTRLPRTGVVLRARLARPVVMSPRLTGPVEELRGGWVEPGWRRLAELIVRELELATGVANPEFLGQVAASHDAMATMARAPRPGAGYLGSEQSLIAGHRFHPSPKARHGDWEAYAPETGARFPLHWLAVREDAVEEGGDLTLLDRMAPPVRDGYRALPAHPWQLALLRPDSAAIVDLGPRGPEAAPTSSVRTVHVDVRVEASARTGAAGSRLAGGEANRAGTDCFLKFGLDVRITNCVRKNAWYELAGSVALTRALRPVFEELPGELLGEPGYRTVSGEMRLREGLGVIVREGVRRFAGTPLLAAALADPHGATLAPLVGPGTREHLLAWWDAYVRHVATPVLRAYLDHGVVLEPHLQNVLVSVADDGMPIRAIFRDLEGTKLLPGPWRSFLADLPAPVARAMTYDAAQGWDRVVYCLFVNHLAEVAAALADRCPSLEPDLWRVVRRHVARHEARIPGGAERLRALLAGVPLPAKANLRTRWARDPDRHAAYVTVPNPLANPVPAPRPATWTQPGTTRHRSPTGAADRR